MEVEIENHGRVKFGKHVSGSWICSDCITERAKETSSSIQVESSSIIHHDHIDSESKSEVSPNIVRMIPTHGYDRKMPYDTLNWLICPNY
jgi:hypothetical protein